MTPADADPRALRLAAQVGAALARPLDASPRARIAGRDLGRLSSAPAFRVPLNRAAARAAAVDALPLDVGFVGRLRSAPQTRLCALLMGQPAASVRDAALLVAAAVRHRSLVAVVLKAERERLRSALGERAMAVVTQEALLLHAALMELDDGSPVGDLGDEPEVRAGFTATGLAVLGRFLDLAEPALAPPFRGRMAVEAPVDGALAAGLGRMTARHCDHVVRLLRRRGPGWATLIG